MLKTAIVSTLGDWLGAPGDIPEKSWIAHGAATLATIGGDLYRTRDYAGGPQLASRLREYDLVGISCTSAGWGTARELIHALQGPKIAVGGPHTLATDITTEPVDYICLGYGENVWEKLLRGDDLPRVSGPEFVDIDTVPPINRGFWRRESAWLGMAAPFASFHFTRGCPWRCKFCQPLESRMTLGQTWRKSPQLCLEEIEAVKAAYGIRGAIIHDDTFGFNKRWLGEFPNLGLDLWVGTRADLVDDETLRHFKRMGVTWVSVGFESGNDRILGVLGKGTTREVNLEAARRLHDAGFKIFANYMFGAPGETPEELWDTVTMMREINPTHHSVSVFSPYPGSYLGDRLPNPGTLRRDPTRAYLPGQHMALIRYAMSAVLYPYLGFPKGRFTVPMAVPDE